MIVRYTKEVEINISDIIEKADLHLTVDDTIDDELDYGEWEEIKQNMTTEDYHQLIYSILQTAADDYLHRYIRRA